jgi:glutaredoxin-related protein
MICPPKTACIKYYEWGYKRLWRWRVQARSSPLEFHDALTTLVTAAPMLLYSEGTRFEPRPGYPEMILMHLSLSKQDTGTVRNILNLTITVSLQKRLLAQRLWSSAHQYLYKWINVVQQPRTINNQSVNQSENCPKDFNVKRIANLFCP